jgi:organic hydroperoxide reductase OsmC/OhrA
MTTNWPETLLRVAAASGNCAWARATAEKNSVADSSVKAARHSGVKPAQRFGG